MSLSQVIVKRLSSGSRIVLKSHFACEISRVNIYQDRCVRVSLFLDLASTTALTSLPSGSISVL